MRCKFHLGGGVRAGFAAVALDERGHLLFGLLGKFEPGLTAAHQLQIDIGQKFGVEQRAVLGAVAVVDFEALA